MAFTYDQYGNRWTQTGGGVNPSFHFGLRNPIDQDPSIVYDADGNLTNDGNGNTFSYDPEGKLTASVVGGVSSTYKNDPLGHRAESVTSAGTFDYVYDPSGRLITEADTTCNSGAPYYPCTDFVYIGASSIPFSQFSDWACCAAYATFNYYDFAGSLRETTSYAGLSAPYQNDPFGDSSSAQPGWFGFAQLLTMGSGLQLSSTRGYHQAEARWLTPDPSGMAAVNIANPQSWNRYAYVLNNPVSATDPSGLECVWDDGSFDSADDPDTGSFDKCGGAGGVWVEPSYFATLGLADWSADGNSFLQNLYNTADWLENVDVTVTATPCATKATTGQRVTAGIQGTLNVGLGEVKTAIAGGVAIAGMAAAPETGGVTLLATAAAGYGVVSSQGQVLSGMGQLYTAISGNVPAGQGIQQVGDIMAGPLLGVPTLAATQNGATAQKAANVESAFTAGSGLVSSKTMAELAQGAADLGLSVMGLAGNDGCN